MNEVYVWKIEYQVSNVFGSKEREIKVITKTDTYAESENVAIKAIEKELEKSKMEFIRILNIKPSKVAYSEF